MSAQLFTNLFGATYAEELRVVVEAVLKAATLCESISREHQNTAISKADESPVTLADYGSQLLISEAIKRVDPTFDIIAEEDVSTLSAEHTEALERIMGRTLSSYCTEPCGKSDVPDNNRFWTIDPIDGTKGYLRGDQYANCVSLVENEQVVLSVIGCPRMHPFGDDDNGNDPGGVQARGTLFVAIRDGGAYEIDPVSLSTTPMYRRLPLFPAASVDAAVLTEGVEASHADHGFSARFAQAMGIDLGKTMRVDSQCKYGLVARGQANIYLRRAAKRDYREKIWDHAPGSLLVEEAGGRVTDLAGSRLRFPRRIELDTQGGLLATNVQEPQEELLKVLATMMQ